MGLGAGFQGGCTKVLGKGVGAMAPVVGSTILSGVYRLLFIVGVLFL